MWTIPTLLCSKCMSRKMWASTPYPAFSGPCLPTVPATPEVNEISPRTWEEAWDGLMWSLPRSASISSPLWFKFNRWVHRRDTAAIKAACYLHIISQSITLTSRGAHFSPAQTHPRPTAGPLSVCSVLRHADWAILEWYDIPLLQEDVLGHLSKVVRRHSLFWAREEFRRKVN